MKRTCLLTESASHGLDLLQWRMRTIALIQLVLMLIQIWSLSVHIARYNTRRTSKLPRQSLALDDPRTISDSLPKLSHIELLAILNKLVHTSVFHTRPIAWVSQIGLKAHSHVFPFDAAATLVSSYQETIWVNMWWLDLWAQKLRIRWVRKWHGDWDHFVLAQSTFSCGFLSSWKMRTRMIWIIDIIDREEKMGIASRNMLKHIWRLLNLQMFMIVLQ